jgi:AcrR family transcriptional regulator
VFSSVPKLTIPPQPNGREKQKRRTRTAILTAARELIRQGKVPSVTDAADAADVSRRTAYRYFPTQEQLLTEAQLEGERPVFERVFEAPELAHDIEARLDALVRTMFAVTRSTELLMRTMIRLTVERGRDEDTVNAAEAEPPRRGYRRIDWIEMALSPIRTQLDESSFERLVSGLALCVGIEALLVLRDIRGLDLAAAEEVSRWTARSLLYASLAESNAQRKASPPLPPER